MTNAALGPGKTRKRAMFGLLDADGWSWAGLKAGFWLVVIIMLLGYLPDRAYYFTVFSTIDVGVLAWSPINLCPPENRTLPCPAPVGAAIPWEAAPTEISLPAARTEGALVQSGTKLLYIGGSDGKTAAKDVYVAELVGGSTFDKWTPGPALPAARADAAAIFLGGSVYVFGGTDESGKPAKDAYILTPDATTGALGQWKTAADAKLPLDLPEARSGAAVVAAADGLIVAGGSDANGPTTTVWKSSLDTNGKLTAWKPDAAMSHPQTDAVGILSGSFLWMYGGQDANGPTGAVQRGAVAAGGDDQKQHVTGWTADNALNLPTARAEPSGWLANGAIYLAGGSDGKTPKQEMYWAIPTADGAIPEWKHLPVDDLQAGVSGAGSVVSGATVFLVGGAGPNGPTTGASRANLAPQPPFFQLGLAGATIPALKVEGEIGQQLGYLNAAGVGTVDFIVLLLIGWAYAHPEKTKELWRRMRRRG